MMSHPCTPCQHGDHDNHIAMPEAGIDGLIGSGWSCPCKGECRSRRGPVPVDGMPSHVWPSWREALTNAHEGIANAHERRKRVFQAAHDAGLSLREIGEAVGLSAAGVHKIIGKQRGPGDGSLLDSPALQRQPRSGSRELEC